MCLPTTEAAATHGCLHSASFESVLGLNLVRGDDLTVHPRSEFVNAVSGDFFANIMLLE